MLFAVLHLSGLVFTYLIFGWIGYSLSKRVPRPVPIWVILLIIAMLTGFLFKFTLLSIFGFLVRFEWALQAVGLGMLIGLILRAMRTGAKTKEAA